jgi:hypothetical protein
MYGSSHGSTVQGGLHGHGMRSTSTWPARKQVGNVTRSPIPTIVKRPRAVAALQGNRLFTRPAFAALQGKRLFTRPAFAALQGKRLFTRPAFAALQGKRQVVRSGEPLLRCRASGKQGINHSEHELETLVGPVSESRSQHMIRHGGVLRSFPRCRFYTFGNRWLATHGSVQSCARAGAREQNSLVV